VGDNGLHLVDLSDDGVALRPDPTSLDTTRVLWRLDLAGAPARALGAAPHVRSAALVLAAATSLGSLRAALARLVPYLRDRVAFGRPVASFQAVQHRLVDLALVEVRAGVAIAAAARALAADPPGSERAAAVAHAYAAEHIPAALDDCIQLTGGIGFTWEYPLHHELRRAVADGTTFGSARHSRERLLTLAGWA
jgi:alkylation response protein AidB-like acyl-CoA dehydrogenase